MLEGVGSIAEMRAGAETSSLRVVLEIHGLEGSRERRAIECRQAVPRRLGVLDLGPAWIVARSFACGPA